MKILVTGVAGFLGSHLSEKFLSEGFDVRILGLSCDFDNVKNVAETGVDLISIGRLTHSSSALDISLDLIG